jgi:hypothetical protein
MKKIIIFAILFLVLINYVVAEEAEEETEAGIEPDSALYFLDLSMERIQSVFISGSNNKADFYINTAKERLAEAIIMINKQKYELAEKTMQRYNKSLNNANIQIELAEKEGYGIQEFIEEINKLNIKLKAKPELMKFVKTTVLIQEETEEEQEEPKEALNEAIPDNNPINISEIYSDFISPAEYESIINEAELVSSDWCELGDIYEGDIGREIKEAYVIGLRTFKGKEMCYAKATVSGDYYDKEYKFYFTEDNEDVWLVFEMGDKEEDYHLSEGEEFFFSTFDSGDDNGTDDGGINIVIPGLG